MLTRHVAETDYLPIIFVVNDWWGGRVMAPRLPRLFFEHFQTTSFIVEQDGMRVAFLIGFISQTNPEEAYIHFVGVHPEYRLHNLGRHLYETFFSTVRELGCHTVRCITSPVNERSIAFHMHMGFSVCREIDYQGPGQDYMLFAKTI